MKRRPGPSRDAGGSFSDGFLSGGWWRRRRRLVLLSFFFLAFLPPTADTFSIPTFALGGGEKNDYVLTGWRSLHEPSELIFEPEGGAYFIASAGRKRGHGMQIHYISPDTDRLEIHNPLWDCDACHDRQESCNNTYCPSWPDWWGIDGNITGQQSGIVQAPSLSYSKSGTVLYYQYSSVDNRTRRDCIGRATQDRLLLRVGNYSWRDDGKPVLCSSWEGLEKGSEQSTKGAIARHPHVIREANTGMPYLIYGYRGAGIHAVALDERDGSGAFTGYSTEDVFNTYNNETGVTVETTETYDNDTKVTTTTTTRIKGMQHVYHRLAQFKQWYTQDSTIEAPYMYYLEHNRFYYLFFVRRRTIFGRTRAGNFKYDKFLRRVVEERRWEVCVCRSKNVLGPFRDKRGKHCGFNGGTVLFSDEGRYRKVSQPALTRLNGTVVEYGEEAPRHDYVFTFHFVTGHSMPVDFDDTVSWYDDYNAQFVGDDSVWSSVETIATRNETSFGAWHLEWESYIPEEEVDDDANAVIDDDEFSTGTCARSIYTTRAECEGSGFKWTAVKIEIEEEPMTDEEFKDTLWPVLTNRTWDPAHVVKKPPPPFRLTTLQLVIIFGTIGCCCCICCGMSVWVDKKYKVKKRFMFKLRIFIFDRCFDHCRCLLVRAIGYRNYLYQRYEDPLGGISNVFMTYELDKKDQLRWLRLWDRLIVEENNHRRNAVNVLSFRHFIDFFELNDDPPLLQRRIFGVFNKNLKGGLTLPEFMKTAIKFCVTDITFLHELAFRLISRHGSTLNMGNGALEEVDLCEIIIQRYQHTGITEHEMKRIAHKIFLSIDDDISGGIDFREFMSFCRRCPTFLLITYRLQVKFRRRIFGEEYWTAFTTSRLDEYRPSKWFEKQLRMLHKTDYPPYHWSKDFKEIYENERESKLKNIKAKMDRDTLSLQELQKRYSTMRKLIASMFRSPTTLRGAYDTWKLVLIREEILPTDLLPEGTIHQMIMEETTDKPADVIELLDEFESKYLGGFEMTSLQTGSKDVDDSLPDELDIITASAELNSAGGRWGGPSFDPSLLSSPGTSRATSRASSAMTESSYASSFYGDSSRPSSYAPSSRPSSMASSLNPDGSSRPSSMATSSRPSTMGTPMDSGGFLNSFGFGFDFFGAGPGGKSHRPASSSDDVMGVGPPRSAGFSAGRRLGSAGVGVGGGRENRTLARAMRRSSRGAALVYPGSPGGSVRPSTEGGLLGLGSPGGGRPSTEGRLYK
jgi:hypothetical protein